MATKEGLKVLSLFDGMSCGQIALNRAGIKIDKYYASEIKNHAIKITRENYPDTIHLGDVRNINTSNFPVIDLLMGGSPCQDFSRGNANRLGLKGDKSSLFYQWIRIFEEIKPKYFLLENVVMPKDDECLFNEYFGMNPLRINSELVSGQMRDRLYWTNIGGYEYDLFGFKTSLIKQPEDRKIKLQDILTYGYTDREKSRALLESDSRPLSTPEKMWHRYSSTGFTTLVFDYPDLDWEKGIRYLNQTELERLQTVPEGYTKSLSRNKAACLLGDGWTVDVIAHIFKELK
jgi:C-5 cytosine-specific DNA methylase